jgi:DNA-binding MarR family transcriptional regulator
MAASWTFLTNHGHVLLAIADDPETRLRDIAARVGITERAAQLIVSDLEAGGYLTKEKVGRRNHYTVVRGRTFRHPAEAGRRIDDLIGIFRG